MTYVWIVMIFGHRIDSVWTTHEAASTRVRHLRSLIKDERLDESAEPQAWRVQTDVTL